MMIWMVIFVLELFGEINKNSKVFNFFPTSYLPQWTWLMYFIYIFFPSKNYFNGNFTYYLKFIFKDMLFSLFKKLNFVFLWASSQYLSFIIIIEDFIYTICFSLDMIIRRHHPSFTWNRDSFIRNLIHTIIFLILLIKVFQSINALRTSNQSVKKLKYVFQIFKYFFLIIFAIVTLFDKIQNFSNVSIIVILSLLTLVLIFWDLKYDFGFIVIYHVKGKKIFYIKKTSN
jgi:hypothetical protein